jgi:hypothetical protein
VTINHKVITKYFKALFPGVDVYFSPGRDHGDPDNLPDFSLELEVLFFGHVILDIT